MRGGRHGLTLNSGRAVAAHFWTLSSSGRRQQSKSSGLFIVSVGLCAQVYCGQATPKHRGAGEKSAKPTARRCCTHAR